MLKDELLIELQRRCSASGIQPDPMKHILRILANEEVISYIFGKGLAPENPSTLVDLLVLTRRSILSIELRLSKFVFSTLFLSRVANISIEITNKVKILLSTVSTGGLYINMELSDLEKVYKFREDLLARLDRRF